MILITILSLFCVFAVSDYCTGKPVACEYFSSASCGDQYGCSWEESGCSGTPKGCSQWSSENSCTSDTDNNCLWSDGYGCTGTAQQCSDFYEESTCSSQDCSWTEPGSMMCQGPNKCDNLLKDVCTEHEGCIWQSGTSGRCKGEHLCELYSIDDCNATINKDVLGCSVQQNMCQGTPLSCESFNTETKCPSEYGCYWVEGEYCSGYTAYECDDYTTLEECTDIDNLCDGCQTECVWEEYEFGACIGEERICPFYHNQATCNDVLGCSWSSNGYCYSKETSSIFCYTQTTEDECNDISGCSWDSYCGGTPPVCSLLQTEEMCGVLQGCTWITESDDDEDDEYVDDACNGESIECSSLDIDSCSTQYGCGWEDGCKASTSGCWDYTEESACAGDSECKWETESGCGGTAELCYLKTESTCEADGCTWHDPGTTMCTGPSSCDDLEYDVCVNHEGCFWHPVSDEGGRCTGDHLCATYTVEECVDVPYCSVVSNTCQGTPSECTVYNKESTCPTSHGCKWIEGEYCAGYTPYNCESYDTYEKCVNISGLCANCTTQCVWKEFPNGGCEGEPNTCLYYGVENDCNNINGCSWSELGYCHNINPLPVCSDYNDSSCGEVYGCDWGETCVGTEPECYNLFTEELCEAIVGCEWGDDEPDSSVKSYISFLLVLLISFALL